MEPLHSIVDREQLHVFKVFDICKSSKKPI